ncbi:MAG: hypothetical protein HC767_01670 [Akkermansiaceae bacterium]|nr:hypothetical protein [Akkermansiaceae bacterium]
MISPRRGVYKTLTKACQEYIKRSYLRGSKMACMKTSSSIDALILGAVIAFSTAAQGEFLSYDSDFSTAPADATLHGNASLTDGVLQLTPAVINRVGSLVIGNFTNENTVTVFDVVLDAFTGNATNAALPADGWCFVWGDVPALSFGENGPANFSGLVVSFDYFVNSPEPGREVTVTWNGVQIGSVLYNSYTNSTVPVHIRLRQGGLLDVWHNGVRLFEGLSISNFTGITSPKWGFGARTGGQTAKVTLDNLRIYPEPILVTNLSTSGEGSLPHSVEAAANVYPGPNQIQFKDSLDGQTIILTGTPLQINNQTLVVDASTLANGITVNANQSSRVLVSGASSANLFLNRVKLTGGKLTGSLPGAGLYWDASLEMLDSSITNCQTDHVGGAMITEARVQLALSQFVRSIQSFDSKYDVGRATTADNQNFTNFTAAENAGKTLFLNPPPQGGAGCAGCHRSPEFDIDPNSRNNGVTTGFSGTDLTNTRSPSLRDLVKTNGATNGGMMHDASFATLDQVIAHYNAIPADNTNLDPRLRRPGGLQN